MVAVNSFKSYNTTDSELKAHSSALTNQRISAMIALFDQSMINANLHNSAYYCKEAIVFLKQIWKSFRPNVYYDPYCRRILELETKVEGIYYPDIMINNLYKRALMMQLDSKLETPLEIFKLNQDIEELERKIRDVLQFFKFTYRLSSQQKPDVAWANNRIIDEIDDYTEEQLKAIAGKKLG